MTEADDRADARRVAEVVLAEDGPTDLTTEVCLTGPRRATGRLEYRGGGVLAGLLWADAVAEAAGIEPIEWLARVGQPLAPGAVAARLAGDLGALLRAERSLLNLLQRACGIATMTRAYVEAVANTGCRILHTRKTAPGLRRLDLAAVAAGGGQLHRTGLADAVMVKDNHWQALARQGRSLADALADARARGATGLYVEVETEAQWQEAVAAGATRLLIDNQPPETVRAWAAAARAVRRDLEIEATGGITLVNARAYARAGADFLSIGALTHSVAAADLAVELEAGS